MEKKYVRYYIAATEANVQYVKLQSDLPFSVTEGKDSIKESRPDAKVTHLAKSKAEKFLQLFS